MGDQAPQIYEVMALIAMVMCGLVLGVLIGARFGWYACKREMAELWPGADRTIGLRDLPANVTAMRDASAPVLPDAQMNELWARVLDASLPKHPDDTRVTQPSAGEYEPPLEDSEDWTDSNPDLLPPRSDVAGLRPGQPIPGLPDTPPIVEKWREMGSAAWDEWAETGYQSAATTAGSWVEPIRLSDDELVD